MSRQRALDWAIGFLVASVCFFPFHSSRFGSHMWTMNSTNIVTFMPISVDEVRHIAVKEPAAEKGKNSTGDVPNSVEMVNCTEAVKAAMLAATENSGVKAPEATELAVNEKQLRCSPLDPRIEAFRALCHSFPGVTDKVTPGHNYEVMYGIFLSGLVHKPIKFLEIGLGCDMHYGPGASARVWHSYLHSDSEIWMAEQDAACAQKYQAELQFFHIVTGDQADPAVVRGWLDTTGGGFDVIVDDGGHHNHQIMNTFEILWPAIKPGGLFFIEDLLVGRHPNWPTKLKDNLCMTDVIKIWIDDLTIPKEPHPTFPLPNGLQSIFCQRDACVLAKSGA